MEATPVRAVQARKSIVPLRVLSDPGLVAHVRAGDREAFGEIFHRYQQPLFRYCGSLLANQADAADALQSTMAGAMRSLQSGAQHVELKPWLYRIAHNECISMLRARKITDSVPEETPAMRATEDVAFENERMRSLFNDLEQLPERQRAALIMRELNGLSFAEIASTFTITENGARQVIHEARVMLLDLEAGREMSCTEITQLISANDRRKLRPRRVKSHLRACADCRAFEASMRSREQTFGAFAPVLPVSVASAILPGLVGSSSTGISAATIAAATGGNAAGASLGAKVAIFAVAGVVTAGGGLVATNAIREADTQVAESADQETGTPTRDEMGSGTASSAVSSPMSWPSDAEDRQSRDKNRNSMKRARKSNGGRAGRPSESAGSPASAYQTGSAAGVNASPKAQAVTPDRANLGAGREASPGADASAAKALNADRSHRNASPSVERRRSASGRDTGQAYARQGSRASGRSDVGRGDQSDRGGDDHGALDERDSGGRP